MINLPTSETLDRALRATRGNVAYDRIAALRDAISALESIDVEVLDVASDADADDQRDARVTEIVALLEPVGW